MPEIIFNEELWETGFAHKCRFNGNSLLPEAKALYISRAVDSLENGTVWGRLTISRRGDENARYTLSYFACDYKTVYTRGELVDIDGVITNDTISAEEKRVYLAELWTNTAINPPDMPLLNAKGRYFWFMLEFDIPSGRPPMSIDRLKIELGHVSWTAYLPEIYRVDENSFLNRFLSMLQSVYADLDKEITGISQILDVELAGRERLSWLSEWVAMSRFSSLPEKRLKALVKNARALSEIKGTRECLSCAIELYTGEKPFIVETVEAMLYEQSELYGGDIHSVTVIIGEDCLTGEADGFAAGLTRLMGYYSPAHARVKTAVLRQSIVLGLHTYLGINTRLSPREALILGGKATVDFGMVV